MGIYTSNRYYGSAYDYASEIPVNEAYEASLGCARIIADLKANDMAIFEASIYNDFEEVAALQEGYGYVNENAFTDVIKKIIEMFKKLIAKIKGIFASFITKLTGHFKEGKKLVKKYQLQISKYANWKGFTCKKVRVPKEAGLKATIDGAFQTNKVSAANYSIDNKLNIGLTGIDGYGNDVDKIKNADNEDLKNAIVKMYLGKNINVTDINDIHEEIMNALFEDEEDLDEDTIKDASYFAADWIKAILSDDKWLKDVEKFNKKLTDNINKIIDNLNKCDDQVAKLINASENKDKKAASKGIHFNSTTDNKVDRYDTDAITATNLNQNEKAGEANTKLQNSIHALQKVASCEQDVITRVTSEYLAVQKFAIAQARKIWTAAAAWSSGVHKESVEYANAIGDCYSEQFYSIMESVR